MKKLFLFSAVLLTVFAATAAAEYDDECYADCKLGPYADCIAQAKSEDACYRESLEPCLKECPQVADTAPTVAKMPVAISTVAIARPVETDCGSQCKIDLESCANSGEDTSACEERMNSCIDKCGYPRPMPPVGCEEQCKREASPQADAALTAASPVAFDEASYKRCFEQRCRPQPPDCYRECKIKYEGNEKGAMACIRERCEKPVLQVCPPSLESGCEMRCARSYSVCAKKAGEVQGDGKKEVLINCRENVGGCLDQCTPKAVPLPAPMPAETAVQGIAVAASRPAIAVAEQKVADGEVTAESAAAGETPEVKTAAPAAEEKTEEPRTFWTRLKKMFFG